MTTTTTTDTHHTTQPIEEHTMTTKDNTSDAHLLQQHWHGWGSPVGFGLFLLLIGGFVTVLAQGISILSSI